VILLLRFYMFTTCILSKSYNKERKKNHIPIKQSY